MVRTSSDVAPDFEFKHRILGAVILVAVAVIVIPIILGDPNASTATTYPEADSEAGEESQVFVSKITPVADESQPVQDGTSTTNQSASSNPGGEKQQSAESTEAVVLSKLSESIEQREGATTTTTPAQQETKIEVPKLEQAEPKEEPKKTETEVTDEAPTSPAATDQTTVATDDRGWIVRIGTFGKIENANRISSLLQEKGFEPMTGKVDTENGSATRVWVGPYTTRVEAARVQTRILDATGEKGLITAYP